MRSRESLVRCLVLVLSFALLGSGAFFGLPSSKAVVGALRILEGELPYRDFWTMYAPGQFYAVAALYSLFGRELLVQGLATALVHAACASLFFALLRRVGVGRVLAGAGALALALARWDRALELESYPVALLGGLLALVALGRWASPACAGDRLLWLAGLATGCAAVFKHDVGAYWCAAVAAGAWAGTAGRTAGSTGAGAGSNAVAHGRAGFAAASRVVLGALCIVLPVVLWLAIAMPADAWHDLIVFPLTDFRAVRAEAYPSFAPPVDRLRAWFAAPGDIHAARAAVNGGALWLAGHLPEFFFGLGLWTLAVRRRVLERPARVLLMAALAGLPLFWWAAHTQPNTHLTSMAVLSALILVLAWSAGDERTGPVWSRRLALPILGVLLAGGLCAEPLEALARLLRHGSERTPLSIPGARGIRISPRESAYFEPIVAFVRANVPADERIHVTVLRNDLPVVGNLRFHVLSGRLPAVRYHEIHPAVTDDLEHQREMVAALEASAVRCIIRWRFGAGSSVWSNARLEQGRDARRELNPNWGSQHLDRWIDERYVVLGEVDEYQVLWRADAEPPAVAWEG